MLFLLATTLYGVLLGFILRIAFFFSFRADEVYSSTDLVKAFFLGFRFDLSVICHWQALFLFVWFIFELTLPNSFKQSWQKHFHRFTQYYFFCGFTLILFFSSMELGFYGFFKDRFNIMLFGFFEDDTWALIKLMWKNYPAVWILIGGSLAFYFQWQFVQWMGRRWPLSFSKKRFKKSLIHFSLLLVAILGARGGVSLFPLGPQDTVISNSIFINQLAFNSMHALVKATKNKMQLKSKWNSNLQFFGYGDQIRSAFADYFQVSESQIPASPLTLLHRKTPPLKSLTKPHVIILVMESFGAYWSEESLRKGSPQFDLMGELKKHFSEDYYSFQFTSSTGATIGSLSSLIAGVPHRPISEFLTESEYLQIPLSTAPARLYKSQGYETRFVYGGNPGWRDINKYALTQGFDAVDGDSQIEKEIHGFKEVHDWGIYDEDLWKYLYKKLSEATKPQFMIVMTTTNHPPYELPKKYRTPEIQIPENLRRRITDLDLAQKRFATLRYSNDQLAIFLNQIKASPLAENIVLAATGDHTFWLIPFNESELLQKSSVPVYIYAPQKIRQERKLKLAEFGSHQDLLPTLYNLSLNEVSYESFAHDLFSKNDNDHFAFNHSNLIFSKAGAVLLTGKEKASSLCWMTPYTELQACEANPDLVNLKNRYRGLMGALDYYFFEQKKLLQGPKPE